MQPSSDMVNFYLLRDGPVIVQKWTPSDWEKRLFSTVHIRCKCNYV